MLSDLIVTSLPLSLNEIDPMFNAASSQMIIFFDYMWSLSHVWACVVKMIDWALLPSRRVLSNFNTSIKIDSSYSITSQSTKI